MGLKLKDLGNTKETGCEKQGQGSSGIPAVGFAGLEPLNCPESSELPLRRAGEEEHMARLPGNQGSHTARRHRGTSVGAKV